MNVVGLHSLVLPSADPEESRRWWADVLGLETYDGDPSALDIGEIPVAFGSPCTVRLVGVGIDGPQHHVDPAGNVVEIVEPDYSAAQRAEESIREFVESAATLDGPPVEDLADRVRRIVVEARDRIGEVLADVPHNKILATQLALGQEARTLPPGDGTWPLHAASSLMSGFVVAGAQRDD